MNSGDIESYVAALNRELRRRFVSDPGILEEVRAHLDDAVAREQEQGCTIAEARMMAIARFGPAPVVAAAYATDRSRMLHRCLSVVAIAFGLAIAWVDSRPGWDATGITAGTLMISAGCLGLLGPRRPWLWALLVGIWIPGYAIVRAPAFGTPAMLLVLLFPLAGAYAGMAVRRWSMTSSR